MIRTFAATALLLAPIAHSAETSPVQPQGTLLTVGSDAACDYSNLTSATFANASIPNLYIRVARNVAPLLHFLPGRQMTIEGGYDTCADTTQSGRTTLNGNGASGSVVLLTSAYSGSTTYNVLLKDLQISGGLGAGTPRRGGGITIDGPFVVTLNNTIVRDNSSVFGGGIYIKGLAGDAGSNELTQVRLTENSLVGANSAESGGGIACEEKANVVASNSTIANNDATEGGGGVFSIGCSMTFGQHDVFQGILFNTASGIFTAGGGIYADSSVVLLEGGALGKSQVGANQADLGGGIYLRNGSELCAYNSSIVLNTAFAGGGVYAQNSTVDIQRTAGNAACHDALRCSELSDNRATAPGSNPGAGGGGLFADGGTTFIGGTFIERNRADGGRGMAVRAVDAPGTDSGFDQNGLIILGSVVAGNSNGTSITLDYESIVEFNTSSGVVGFTTFARNLAVFNVVYTPTTGDFYGIDIYGSVFDEMAGNAAGPGANGPVPGGDCNRLHETTSLFAKNSARSTTLPPQFADLSDEDYRLAGLNLVDWCDASGNIFASQLSADGGPRPVDDPGIAAEFGNYDLGGLERGADVAISIFSDGFED